MATILCIDDDVALLESQKHLLEGKGYTVFTALDGLTGAALIRKDSIDAVVLDFNVPSMNSAVAEILMQKRPTPPLVVCSGCFDEIPEWLKWLADGLYEKADGPAALLAIVEKLVRKKALARTA